jgi:hypothetical protein
VSRLIKFSGHFSSQHLDHLPIDEQWITHQPKVHLPHHTHPKSTTSLPMKRARVMILSCSAMAFRVSTRHRIIYSSTSLSRPLWYQQFSLSASAYSFPCGTTDVEYQLSPAVDDMTSGNGTGTHAGDHSNSTSCMHRSHQADDSVKPKIPGVQTARPISPFHK